MSDEGARQCSAGQEIPHFTSNDYFYTTSSDFCQICCLIFESRAWFLITYNSVKNVLK
jgi:hypothetical protein